MDSLVKEPEVVDTDLGDGAVLLNLKTKFYYSLNETGLVLWRHLDTAQSEEELCAGLLAEYDLGEDQARDAVASFVETLRKEELLTDASGPPDGHSAPASATQSGSKKPFVEPEVIKHDEPLHEVVTNPFDSQLPLAE